MASTERRGKLVNTVLPTPENFPYHPLTAITTTDGRDRKFGDPIRPIMSEYGLQRTRLEVMGEYLIYLSKEGITPRKITSPEKGIARGVSHNFTIENGERITEIEATENHDVRSAQKLMRELIGTTSLSDLIEFSGLGQTSEDITGNALRINIMRAVKSVMVPKLRDLKGVIHGFRDSGEVSYMQGLTHGQAAAPTTMEKEFANFEEWLGPWIDTISKVQLTGKMNGAVGNWNSLRAIDPERDWISFSRKFIDSLGLKPRDYTIQINPYDDIIHVLYDFAIANGFLSKVSSDMWMYISRKWIKQIPVAGESGSHAMPQKVNPIKFEKAEGKLQESIDGIHALGRRLLDTRFQRDLRDSTQAREIGDIFAKSLAGYDSLIDGFGRVVFDKAAMRRDLEADWTVLTEPVQIILRAETDMEDPYKVLRGMVRGTSMSAEEWIENVVNELPVSKEVRRKIAALTPTNYIGYAVELAEGLPKKIKLKK